MRSPTDYPATEKIRANSGGRSRFAVTTSKTNIGFRQGGAGRECEAVRRCVERWKVIRLTLTSDIASLLLQQ